MVVGGWSYFPCPPTADCVFPETPALNDGASFDPVTQTWQRIATAPVPLAVHSNKAVVGDQLYLFTDDLGREDSPLSFLRYDTATDSWSSLPTPAPASRIIAIGDRVAAIAFSDEEFDGGDAVFDPETQEWMPLPDDPLGPSFGREAVWLGDELLLTATGPVPNPGSNKPPVMRLAILNGSLTEWAILPDAAILGGGPTFVAGKVVFPWPGYEDGGTVNNWGRSYPYGGVFDPETLEWQALPEPPSEPGFDDQGLTGRGPYGWDGPRGMGMALGNRTFVSGHLLNPATGEWLAVPRPGWADRMGAAVATNSDTFFVWGGYTAEGLAADGHVLRVEN